MAKKPELQEIKTLQRRKVTAWWIYSSTYRANSEISVVGPKRRLSWDINKETDFTSVHFKYGEKHLKHKNNPFLQ